MFDCNALLRIASIGFVIAFASAATVANAESNKTFRITESRDGNLGIDGKAVSQSDVDRIFKEIATEHGHVQYYRQAPAESADATTTEILNAGEKYNVVIRLASNPDFSDVQPGAIESGKAIALYAAKPEYPESARKKHLTGAGVFVLHVDPYTGLVRSVQTEKSTGAALLDKCARTAFEKWRFKRNTMKTNRVKIPIRFTMTGATETQ